MCYQIASLIMEIRLERRGGWGLQDSCKPTELHSLLSCDGEEGGRLDGWCV